MKVMIVGLGRMGTGLAGHLIKKGHHVIVIDSRQDRIDLLGNDFAGTRILGDGFDRGILSQAGIEQVDALVACTESDEVNAVIARVAKNIYKVPRVIARLYDPEKADIYHRLGIQTMSTIVWGIERAAELLTYNQMDTVYDIGHGNVSMVRIEVPSLLVGHLVKDISALGEIQVVSISRNDKTFIPTTGTILESEDVLYIAVTASAVDKLKSMLDFT